MYPYSKWAIECHDPRLPRWAVTLRLSSGKVVCSYPQANNHSQAIAAATMFYTEKPEVLSVVPYNG